MGSEVPWRMTRLEIEEANGAPRNIHVSPTKCKPHTARWRRRVITENLWEIGWISYQGLIRGAQSLSGARCASSSSKWFDSKYTAFSPTSCAVGGSETTSFPLRREELWPFAGIMVQGFDWSKQIGVFEGGEMVKKGKRRECLCWKGRRSLCLDYEGIIS